MADFRLKEYKNSGRDNNENRNRRVENNVELRKNKRTEQMLKRRQVCLEEDETPTTVLGNSQVINREQIRVENLPAMVQGIMHGDAQQRFLCVKQCRMLLSKEKNPPIQAVLDTGIMPIIVQFMGCADQPQLQLEAAWVITNIASGSSEQTYAVVEQGALQYFIKLLQAPGEDIREQATWGLGNIAGDGGRLRDLCLQYGVMQPLLEILQPHASKLSLCRNATWCLSNLCRGKNPQPDFSIVRYALPTLASLLQSNDDEIVTDTAWAISYMSDGSDDRIQAVVEAGVVPRLVELSRHHSAALITPALRAIGNIVTGTEQQTQIVLDAGALDGMGRLLSHAKEAVRKEACWCVSNITAGSPRQIQQVLEANVLAPLQLCMAQGDLRTRREALWAFCNLAASGSREQVRFIVHQGVLKPLCDLLHVNDARLIEVGLEAVENILRSGQGPNGNEYADAIDEHGGVEQIEQLQNHENDDIYQKANRIVTTYYGEEDDEPAQMMAPQMAAGGAAFAFTAPVQFGMGGAPAFKF